MTRRARGSIFTRPDRAGYYVRYTGRDGRRKQRYGGRTVRLAEKKLREFLEEVDAPDEDEAAPAPSLMVYLPGYLERFRARRTTEQHFNEVKAKLLAIAELLGEKPVDQVTEADAHDLVVGLLEEQIDPATRGAPKRRAGGGDDDAEDAPRRRSPKTAKRYVSALSGVWKDARRRGVVDRNVWAEVEFPRTHDIERAYLEQEELERFYALFSEHYRPLVTFLGEMGCRLSDATRLTWDRVSADRAAVTFVRTKNRTTRTVPLPPLARQAVEAVHVEDVEPGARVFGHIGLHSGAGQRAWKDAARELGHAGLTAHGLRHARTALLVQHGVPLPTVATWGGWKSPRLVLELYGRWLPENALDTVVETMTNAAPARRRRTEDASPAAAGE